MIDINVEKKKVSMMPCPICKELIFITGKDSKNYSLASCGHRFRFKRSKSRKDMDRKYRETEWGLELIDD